MLILCPVFSMRACDGCSEKVLVPLNKSFILLEGEGKDQTFIEWADHAGGDTVTASSPTFTSYPTDFMARDISFKVGRRPLT
jgi:pectinesterase